MLVKSRRKRSPKQIMKEKAWKEFSKYVRTTNANPSGMVKCFTCKNYKHWKEMNAGHYIHGKLDFDEMNVNAQCVQCNKYNSGRLDAYTLNLIEIYGLKEVENLRLRASMATTENYPLEYYELIYQKYKKINDERNFK